MRMRDLGINDQQHQIRRLGLKRNQAGVLVPAVQEDCVAFRAPERRRLVHDARRGADELVLRPLRGKHHILCVEPGTRQLV